MRQSLLLLVALAFCAGLSGTSLADTDTRTNTSYNFTTDSGSQWGRSSYGGVREVAFTGNYSAGTIIIRTGERKLYLVLGDGRARVYGVGVGRSGFQWSGSSRISRKAEWPGWTPPAAMRRRQPELPAYMPGGPNNPLGARALYLGGSLYRIHGTNQAQTIGQAVSSGCIRMLNAEVIDLYNRVRVGTRVVVTQ
jgi:lipoprotein-anchoring transpeptidase ErfK/SrfK